MKNKEIALLNISRLKLRHKILAQTAEYVTNSDTFVYSEMCKALGISKGTAHSRLKDLRAKGFFISDMGKSTNNEKIMKLTSCVEWIPNDKAPPKSPDDSSLVFVNKSLAPIPSINYLWKVSFGLVIPDLNEIRGRINVGDIACKY